MKYCRTAEEFEPFVRARGFGQILDNLANSPQKHPSDIIYRLRAGLGSHPEDSLGAQALWNLAGDNGFLRNVRPQLTIATIIEDNFLIKYGVWYEEARPLSPELWQEIFTVLREGLTPAQSSILEFWLTHEYRLDYALTDAESELLRAAVKNTERFLADRIKKILL